MSKLKRIIHPPEVVQAFIRVVSRYIPLPLKGTRITAEEVLEILGYASANQMTIEASCQQLANTASGNRLREVIQAALPARSVLQRELNTLLRSQLPAVLLRGKRDYEVALDITLIPYYGEVSNPHLDVVGGATRDGTHYFHGYATACIVHHQQRHVLCVMIQRPHQTRVQLVRRLLKRLQRLGIRIRRVLLDSGFSGIEVFRLLERRHLSYLMPLPVRGQSGGVRRLFHGSHSYYTWYTLCSQAQGRFTVRAAVVHRPHPRGVQWMAFVVGGLTPNIPCDQIRQLYRHRFGIESSYRQMNQVRARTSSRNATLRLLLVGLAFVLVNLYVTLRDQLAASPTHPHLTLCRLAALLQHGVESLLSVAPVFQLNYSHALS